MKVVSFKIDEGLLELLEEFARRKKVTKSEIIRRAIEQYLSQNMKKRPYMTKRIRVF